MHREVSRSGVTPWPTRVGFAIISAAFLTRVLAALGSVAIGALLALGLFMVVDYLVSMVALYRRPVTLTVGRTRVVAPDELQMTVQAPKGVGHLQLATARVNLWAQDSDFCTIRSQETTQTFALPSAAWGGKSHLRFRSDLSILGLVSARRWTTQVVPKLCFVPEPLGEKADLVGVEDAGRLREYVPGDRMGMVAWGTTARTGQLHVRAAAPDADELVVLVDLGTIAEFVEQGGLNAETAVARAMRVGEELLAQGQTFQLITTEATPAHATRTLELALASPQRARRPKLEGEFGNGDELLFEGKAVSRIASSTVHDRDELIRRLSAVDLSAPMPRPAGPHIEITPAGVRSVN